jgi:arabinose-5-phosphate isomerase
MQDSDVRIDVVREVLRGEHLAILAALERVDPSSFLRALEVIQRCTGKVLTTGTGTSGIIARKIAATLTSTGTPSVFLHPSDALHGGLGAVGTGDVVIAVSNSGETGELLVILPYLRHRHVSLIAILGNLDSTLARACDVVLDAVVDSEAGPLALAPTSSSTVALAVGDALAMAVLASNGFEQGQFALNHPSGRLGRRLSLRVEDVVTGELPRPVVQIHETLMDAIERIGSGGVGAVIVLDDERLVGIVTDGDVRRAFQSGIVDPRATSVTSVMTSAPIVVRRGTLAYDALQMMEDRESQISVLPVVEIDESRCVGLIRVHDLVRAGI